MPAIRTIQGVPITSGSTAPILAATVTGPYSTAPPPNPATLTP